MCPCELDARVACVTRRSAGDDRGRKGIEVLVVLQDVPFVADVEWVHRVGVAIVACVERRPSYYPGIRRVTDVELDDAAVPVRDVCRVAIVCSPHTVGVVDAEVTEALESAREFVVATKDLYRAVGYGS